MTQREGMAGREGSTQEQGYHDLSLSLWKIKRARNTTVSILQKVPTLSVSTHESVSSGPQRHVSR